MASGKPYDPLAKAQLAESVTRELFRQDALPLGDLPTFSGAGIYAIYYKGDTAFYKPLADSLGLSREEQRPIYVGQAAPKASKGGGELASRLRDHARSVEQCSNLNLDDFVCRRRVVEEVWITLAETMLIERFQPVWNVVLRGFGNHGVGGPRERGVRPPWDTVHPGRGWAESMRANPVAIDEWIARITRSLAGDRSAQILTAEEAVADDMESET